MKIISKFKDYYDGVGAHNQDPLPLYIRHTEVIDSYWKDPIKNIPITNYRQEGWILFCGRVYPFYRIHFMSKWNGHSYEGGGEFFCYDVDSVIKVYEEHAPEKNVLDKLNNYKPKGYGSKWDGRVDLSVHTWKKWRENNSFTIKDDIFRHYNAPVILLHHEVTTPQIVINPCLREYNFQSQVDPYTAYQEIDMFVGNNLVNQEDPNLKMTEALKVHSKGMDKWSFRKKGPNSQE